VIERRLSRGRAIATGVLLGGLAAAPARAQQVAVETGPMRSLAAPLAGGAARGAPPDDIMLPDDAGSVTGIAPTGTRSRAVPLVAPGAPPDINMPPAGHAPVTAIPRRGAGWRRSSTVAPGGPPRPHHALRGLDRADQFTAARSDSTPAAALATRRYYAGMALGFAASILFHESAHFAASYLVGAHPTVGVDAGRPTVYSGIDANREPHKQLLFSSAGLVAQAALDEAILDIPHAHAGAFERGVLLGGVSTALFYISLGRNASVSDITYIARTSGWSKTQVSLVVGGVAALHTVRIGRTGRYARFFLAPGPDGRLALNARLAPGE